MYKVKYSGKNDYNIMIFLAIYVIIFPDDKQTKFCK